MKKTCVLLLLVTVLFTSCDMFTTTLAESFARDYSEVLKDSTAKDIVAFLNSETLSGEDSKKVTNALAGKDAEELKNLPLEDKSTIINVAASGILPSPDKILGAVNTDDVLNMGEEDISDLIAEMLGSIDSSVDTGAIEVFFTEEEDEDGNSTITSLLEESPDALLMGTLALTASIAKESGVLTDVLDSVNSGDTSALDTLLEETTVALEGITMAEDGSVSISDADKETIKEALATDLDVKGTGSEGQVDALFNVVIELYEVSQDTDPDGGLNSLGALGSLFEGLFPSPSQI